MSSSDRWRIRRAAGFAILFLAISGIRPSNAEPPAARPVTVSPGASDESPAIAGSCPVLSWAALSGARDYELAIYAVEDRAIADAPAVSARMGGAALSWTPPLEKCLATGDYAWAVRADTASGWSVWSEPRFFRVEKSGESPEIRRLVERLVAEQLAAHPPALESQAASAPARRAETPVLDHKLVSAPSGCKAGDEVFADVPASSPYCGWIERLYREGVTAGCGNGMFCPTSPVTRQQMAELLEKVIQRRGVRELHAGDRHTCALLATGGLVCWGVGEPSVPAGLFTAVSPGPGFTCALDMSGLPKCWGSNANGQATPPPSPFQAIAAGQDFACGIEFGGQVTCWGRSDLGQLTPPAVEFRSITLGLGHGCGITTEGEVACWGWNSEGQSSPPPGMFTMVSAGNWHNCALRVDGTVACWGFNGAGQAAPPAGTFRSIAAGGTHTCGLRTDGRIECWGNNFSGQASPPWGSYVSVTSGTAHSCALSVDGGVICWGLNQEGIITPPGWL